MPDRVLAGRGVEQGIEVAPGEAAMGPEAAEGLRAGLARHRGHPVHLDPIAGGEDHRLLERPPVDEVAQDLADLVLLERELLPHLERRGPVAHPGHEEHAAWVGPSLVRRQGARGGARPRSG